VADDPVVLTFHPKAARPARACRGCGIPLRFHPAHHTLCKRCWALSRLHRAVRDFTRAEQLSLQLQGGGRGERWRR